MHILIAPNAFKHSLTATQAAQAIQAGLQQSNLNCACTCFPVADGGDGTGILLIEHLKGQIISAQVNDPLGRPVNARFGLIDDGATAVIEMADASGIRLLQFQELDPMITSSYGTGQLIKQALDQGVNKIIIGLGGSATVDGGAGLLQALGVQFFNAAGNELPAHPQALLQLNHISTAFLDARLAACKVVVLCDVQNTLLGQEGAAPVFGPQKGASAQQVAQLESFLTLFSKVSLQTTGIDMAQLPHGGAAGGCAAGLQAFLKAQLVDGASYFLQLTNFDSALQGKQLLITGEGSIDEQTLQGKAPFVVAAKAKAAGIPVVGLAGQVPLQASSRLQRYFDVLLAIGHQPDMLAQALASTGQNLTRTVTALGNLLATANFKLTNQT